MISYKKVIDNVNKKIEKLENLDSKRYQLIVSTDLDITFNHGNRSENYILFDKKECKDILKITFKYSNWELLRVHFKYTYNKSVYYFTYNFYDTYAKGCYKNNNQNSMVNDHYFLGQNVTTNTINSNFNKLLKSIN